MRLESQYNTVNQTLITAEPPPLHSSVHEQMNRELLSNQSNTVLHDISLLSKIGGGCQQDAKGNIKVMPSLSYGGGSTCGGNGKQNSANILVNQSSQQNLPSNFYEGSSMATSYHVNASNAKSAAGGKRIGLSRGSLETTHSGSANGHMASTAGKAVAEANQSQVVVSQAFIQAAAKDQSHM